jgi:hypothetical protein
MDDPRKIKYNILEKLLIYAPSEVIAQIILNVDPEDLEYVCSINKRVHEICKQPELQDRYKERYPGFFYGELKEYEGSIPDFIREKDSPEDLYTDGNDNWVFVDHGYAKYTSRDFNGYRLVVKLHNVDDDYWMKDISLYDTVNKGSIIYEDGVEVIEDILKSMGKSYLNVEYVVDPESVKAATQTIKFMKELQKRGVKFLGKNVSFGHYYSYDEPSSDSY